MNVTAQTQQITLDAAQILTTLSQGGYQIKGIQYLYVSCSSHVISHIFRGVSIAYDRGQMEQLSKGVRREKLDTFAYYSDKCYQLLF